VLHGQNTLEVAVVSKWKYITKARLDAARVAIENTLADRDILTALSVAGYGEAELWEGQALYLEAMAQASQQDEEAHKEETPSDVARKALMNAWIKAERDYVHTRRTARAAFRSDPKTFIALKLNQARKTSLSGWLEQATIFYNDLLQDDDRVAILANLGYDRSRLEDELVQVQSVSEAQRAYEEASQKAAGMASTVLIDLVPAQLDAWMAGFQATAEEALKDHPQWLEKLGFSPRRE
jgi:hypothetical protein